MRTLAMIVGQELIQFESVHPMTYHQGEGALLWGRLRLLAPEFLCKLSIVKAS